MISSPWHYFTDPVLQAPTIGSMLMCFSSALVGVIVFLRKRSLLGEALSHAAYPGVVLSVLVVATLFPQAQEGMAIGVLIGAFMTSLLGLWVIERLEKRFRVQNDAALCFVLAIFFGVGITIASRLQVTHALWYKTIQIFLYGQAATMTDIHVVIYFFLALFTLMSLALLYPQIQVMIFDRAFARTIGIALSLLDALLFILLVLAIVIGIRSVGVVLMAGMLIAPAVAARQFTDRLWMMLLIAAFFGAFSGFLGNYLSVELPHWGQSQGLDWKFSLPTGPMILLSASSLCLLSLLFAPNYGLINRLIRVMKFRYQCLGENLLKHFWKKGEGVLLSIRDLNNWQSLSPLKIRGLVFCLTFQGWMRKGVGAGYLLTSDGWERAEEIVRLHRLWEVYLVYLGQGREKVHRSAEEMEHILTPELERELTELLQDPKQDPHHQPIPPPKEFL